MVTIIYDKYHDIRDQNQDYSKLPFIIKTNMDFDEITKYQTILKIEGKTYHWCLSNEKKQTVFVKEMKIADGEETGYSSDPICPYCNEAYSDAFELDDEAGRVDCSCGAELTIVREMTIEYHTTVTKKPTITEVK